MSSITTVVFFYLCCAFSFVSNAQEEISRSQFPSGFFFGAATSSYQIEGAVLEDGRGLNNWDAFSHTQGKIFNGDNADVADDHYHRYEEDIELMHTLGINAYRLSISWTRILPRGRFGDVNSNGIMFYNKLIDNLLLRGIEPFVTISHHDIPLELEDRYQSWLSPLIQDDFVYYADICFKSFGDRVKYWITINEPNLFVRNAYKMGIYPPGRCSAPFGNCSSGDSETEPIVATHNMIISHAKAATIYKKHYQAQQGGYIGILPHASAFLPISDDEADREAANRAMAFSIPWIFDPLLHGDYPPEMRLCLGDRLPKFSHEERNMMKDSLDYIAINHYATFYAKDCMHSTSESGCHAIEGFMLTLSENNGVLIGERARHPQPTGTTPVLIQEVRIKTLAHLFCLSRIRAVLYVRRPLSVSISAKELTTAFPSFFVVPYGLEKIIEYLKERYNNIRPMFVLENGMAQADEPVEKHNELLQDIKRVNYHKSYLASLLRAMRNGADVRGYFVWSLIDNFEWTSGYKLRFGLYYVDYLTLKRTPKASAKWYKDFLTNGTHAEQAAIKTSTSKNQDVTATVLKEE
ncbi:hypothetical protein IFM89_002146 [Coptis chinensis]|uniref:Beta-glucosidase 18-like n=1 Tax=Coptis chinensis TaxID=261450 RepID=A0A835GWG8_9MAGN|nr:hypothetical protein IFM89_002146 [Coptis chinensis]